MEHSVAHGAQEFPQKPRAAVRTIHGQVAYLAAGDWVITEPDGIHHYPCKQDIFDSTYEPVTPEESNASKSLYDPTVDDHNSYDPVPLA